MRSLWCSCIAMLLIGCGSDGADRRVATFTQRFGTNTLQKELVLVRESGSWRIAQEKVVEVK